MLYNYIVFDPKARNLTSLKLRFIKFQDLIRNNFINYMIFI